MTLEGDAYEATAGKNVNIATLTPPGTQAVDELVHNRGSNIVGRWTHTYSQASELSLQAFVDQVHQGEGFGAEDRTTYDLDLQHRFALGTRNDVVWGLGYRFADIYTTSTFSLSWAPTHQVQWSNVFVQDEIAVVPQKLAFYVGCETGAQQSDRIQRAAERTGTVDTGWSSIRVGGGFAGDAHARIVRAAGAAQCRGV